MNILGSQGIQAILAKIYQQLELHYEVNIVSVASNDTTKDNDIYSIFGGEDTNLIEESNLLEFNQVFGDLELENT